MTEFITTFEEKLPFTRDELSREDGNALIAFLRHGKRSKPELATNPLSESEVTKIANRINNRTGEWYRQAQYEWDNVAEDDKLGEALKLFHGKGIDYWITELEKYIEKLRSQVGEVLKIPDIPRRQRTEQTDPELARALSDFIKDFAEDLKIRRVVLRGYDQERLDEFTALAAFIAHPEWQSLEQNNRLLGQVAEQWKKQRVQYLLKNSAGIELIKVLMDRGPKLEERGRVLRGSPVIGQGPPREDERGALIGETVQDLLEFHSQPLAAKVPELDIPPPSEERAEELKDRVGKNISELSEEGVQEVKEHVAEKVAETVENALDRAIVIVASSARPRAKDVAEIIWRELAGLETHPTYLKIAREIDAGGEKYDEWIKKTRQELQNSFLEEYQLVLDRLRATNQLPEMQAVLREVIDRHEVTDMREARFESLLDRFPSLRVIQFFSDQTVANLLDHLQQNLRRGGVTLFNEDLPRPYDLDQRMNELGLDKKKNPRASYDVFDRVRIKLDSKGGIIPELAEITKREQIDIINGEKYIVVNMDRLANQAYEKIIANAVARGQFSQEDLAGKKIIFIGEQVIDDTGFKGVHNERYYQLGNQPDSEYKILPSDAPEVIQLKRVMEWVANGVRTFTMEDGSQKKMRTQDAVQFYPENMVYAYLEVIKKLPWRLMHSELLKGRQVIMPIIGHSDELDFFAALLTYGPEGVIDFERTATEMKDSIGREWIATSELVALRLTPQGEVTVRFRGREREWDLMDLFIAFTRYTFATKRQAYYILPHSVFRGKEGEDGIRRVARLRMYDHRPERMNAQLAVPGVTIEIIDDYRKQLNGEEDRDLLQEYDTYYQYFNQLKSRYLGANRAGYTREMRALEVSDGRRATYEDYRDEFFVENLAVKLAEELEQFAEKSVEEQAYLSVKTMVDMLLTERGKLTRDAILAGKTETPTMFQDRLRAIITRLRSRLPTSRFKAINLNSEQQLRAFADNSSRVMRNLEIAKTRPMEMDDQFFREIANLFYGAIYDQSLVEGADGNLPWEKVFEKGKNRPDSVFEDMVWKVRNAIIAREPGWGIDPRVLAHQMLREMHTASHDENSILEGERKLDRIQEEVLAQQMRI